MRRVIAWFADNGVAANLLMMVIIVGGLLSLRHKTKVVEEPILAEAEGSPRP